MGPPISPREFFSGPSLFVLTVTPMPESLVWKVGEGALLSAPSIAARSLLCIMRNHYLTSCVCESTDAGVVQSNILGWYHARTTENTQFKASPFIEHDHFLPNIDHEEKVHMLMSMMKQSSKIKMGPHQYLARNMTVTKPNPSKARAKTVFVSAQVEYQKRRDDSYCFLSFRPNSNPPPQCWFFHSASSSDALLRG